MDASSILWTNWHEQLKELLTGIHGHQKKTLALFVLLIVLSGCAVMQRVAETVSERGLSEAKMTSIERRFARFIANERIVVPLIWKLFLAQVAGSLPWTEALVRAGQYTLSRQSDHCLSRTARAFPGVACGLGGDASPDQMGRRPMANRGTLVGSGRRPSARHVLHADSRPWVKRDGTRQAVPKARLALSVADLSGAYLSALRTRENWRGPGSPLDRLCSSRAFAGMAKHACGKRRHWKPL
jgi:hypothetical protein